MTPTEQRLTNLEAAVTFIAVCALDGSARLDVATILDRRLSETPTPFPAAWCPQCGPILRIDEDGTCLLCGADSITHPETLAILRAGWEARGGK